MEWYIELGHTDDVEHKQEYKDNYYHGGLMKYKSCQIIQDMHQYIGTACKLDCEINSSAPSAYYSRMICAIILNSIIALTMTSTKIV